MKTMWSKLRMGLLAALVLSVVRPCAADGPSREYLVKAAFIYNFTQFITWPKDAYSCADSPFIVGVLGDDPFDGTLEQAMDGKTVDGHPVVVRHFASVDQLGPCQVLFVPQSQEDSMAAVMSRLAATPVLTIGESEDFLPGDGGIRFLLEDGKIHFEINPAATDAARLKISAKLMKLARIYKG